METNSSPLPARVIPVAETVRVARPRVRHRRPVAKRKTVARKPAAKPVAKAAARAPVKRHAKPRRRHKAIAARPVGTRIAQNDRPTLHKLTFASPLCDDLAPAMQAFGLDQLPIGGLGDAPSVVADALAPQNTVFAAAYPGPGASTGGGIPGFGGFGGFVPNGGGGGNSGGTTPGGGTGNTGGTTPGGTIPGGGDNGGGIPGGTTPAAVPEPASWMMMIFGFGMTGAMLRRRRRAERQAACA